MRKVRTFMVRGKVHCMLNMVDYARTVCEEIQRLLAEPDICDRCGEGRELMYDVTTGEWLCNECWEEVLDR